MCWTASQRSSSQSCLSTTSTFTSTNANTAQFVHVLAAHGLASRVTSAMHDLGGILDMVTSRTDLPSPDVDVLDVGLSDHRLLRWSSSLTRPAPVYVTTTGRPWPRLDAADFTAALQSSSLCRPDVWSGLDVDELAQLYDSVGCLISQTYFQSTGSVKGVGASARQTAVVSS